MFQHLSTDVTSNAHDRLFRQTSFSQFRDCLMPQVMEPESMKRASQFVNVGCTLAVLTSRPQLLHRAALRASNGSRETSPRRAPILHRFRRVNLLGLLSVLSFLDILTSFSRFNAGNTK